MNPEIKAAWVTDLRAHPELQGKAALHSEGKFCVIGRLCEVHRVVTGKGVWADEPNMSKKCYIAHGDDGKHSASRLELPKHVMKWAGLSSQNPVVRSEWGHFGLATANDDGLPFAQIAVLIEEQL